MDTIAEQTVETPPRPARRPLVSPLARILLAAGLLVFLGAGVAALLYASSFSISVPDVVGESGGVARTQLSRLGLEYAITERRFSSEPEGTVLEQSPPPETMMRAGSTVSVVLSAGSEDLVMPDVIGDGMILARGRLEALGLSVRVEGEPSDAEPDTVLATYPAPGARVRTGEIVRMTIAVQGVESSVLLPYQLAGNVFLIDPAPGTADDTDPSLDVARRLRALLEASGAQSVMSRTAADPPDLAEETRIARTVESTPGVVIGFETAPAQPGGLAIGFLAEGDDLRVTDSRRLADMIAQAFAEDDLEIARETPPADAVLEATQVPGVRIRLGSFAVPEDASRFGDPGWADRVARAVYRAIGEVYGTQ